MSVDLDLCLYLCVLIPICMHYIHPYTYSCMYMDIHLYVCLHVLDNYHR